MREKCLPGYDCEVSSVLYDKVEYRCGLTNSVKERVVVVRGYSTDLSSRRRRIGRSWYLKKEEYSKAAVRVRRRVSKDFCVRLGGKEKEKEEFQKREVWYLYYGRSESKESEKRAWKLVLVKVRVDYG